MNPTATPPTLRARAAALAARVLPWRRHPVVRQYDHADCGPAALLSVLRFHGGDASLVRVRELSATDSRGSTLLSLHRAAGALGLEAQGAQGTYEQLMEVKEPCIAHVVVDGRLQHYVVVYRATAAGVLLGDPGRGRVTCTRQEFMAMWTRGAVLLLKPTPSLVRQPAPHWLRWISAHFHREETWLYQSLFLAVAYTGLGLLTAVFVQWLVDRFIPLQNLGKVIATGAFLVALQLLRAGAGYLRQRFLVELNKRVSLAVSTEFLGHLFRLPASFFDTRKKGDITARINDAVKIQGALLRVIGGTLVDALVIAGSLAFLFVMAPRIGWVALASVPVYAGILLVATRRIHREQREVMAGYAALESSYIDSLDGIGEIRAYRAGGFFAWMNGELYRAFQERTATLGRTQARVSLMAEVAGGLLVIGSLVYGAALVISGDLKLGQMMAAYSLLAGMLPSVAQLVEANVALQGASVAASRLMDLLLVEPEGTGGAEPFRMEHALELRGAGFTWPKGARLLHGVDLVVERGRLTALCGMSGAGKSTLVKLLERTYPLTAGTLCVDGRPAEAVSMEAWRRSVATVPETVKVFNGTLADNLVVGRPVESAAWLDGRLAELGFAPFLGRFTAGLATPLGEDGRQLSSGERQVVGMIRALLEEPDVLVMDEGINAIDVQLAGAILQALSAYARDHAVLLISHNLRTLLRADVLYLLEAGTMVERGAPLELLDGATRFRELWDLQESATPALV